MQRAIVLAGGGAKGAYQIGFWRALRELGIDYQIVTGSSVGALNAVLMAQGNYDEDANVKVDDEITIITELSDFIKESKETTLLEKRKQK